MNAIREVATRSLPKNLWIGALSLAVCLSASPAGAQQNQPRGQTQAEISAASANSGAQSSQGDAQAGNVPSTLILPMGTLVQVRTTDWLSTDRNHPGDTFSATLEQPLVIDGWVVARRGQTVLGRVAVAQKASRNSAASQLKVELTELTLVDGQQLPMATELVQATPERPPVGRDVNTVATTTAIGAVIGAVAGGGEGAAIGAVAGVAAGGMLITRGRPTLIPSESVLNFRLESPLSISTDRSQVAFRPVSQADYNSGRDQDAYANYPRRRVRGYPPYYLYACSPRAWGCYGPGYYGPYPFFGVGTTFVFRGGFRR
jgi:hypothetical protein